MNPRIRLLENILRDLGERSDNAVNCCNDIDNLKVLVWTFSKAATTTLAKSFQKSIDSTFLYKNVTHSHHESCWHKYISPELEKIGFSFELLIEFINKKGVHPLVVQSYRCPVERLVSEAFHYQQKGRCEAIARCNALFNDPDKGNLFTKDLWYIDYLKTTFKGIWTHDFDKEKGFGFYRGDTYDILYVAIDFLDDLPSNIKSIEELSDYHNLSIEKTNEASGKIGYETLKENLSFSKESIDHLYDIHWEPLNFFYNEDRILNMKQSVISKYN